MWCLLGSFYTKKTARDQWCHIEHLCVLTFGFGLVKCTKLLYLDYGLLSGLDRRIGVQPAKITKKVVTPDMQISCQRRVWGTCTIPQYPGGWVFDIWYFWMSSQGWLWVLTRISWEDWFPQIRWSSRVAIYQERTLSPNIFFMAHIWYTFDGRCCRPKCGNLSPTSSTEMVLEIQ